MCIKKRDKRDKEANVLKKINHKKIPSFIEYRESKEEGYLFMKYIEGVSLYQFVKKYGRQSEKIVFDWIKKIIKILDYIHRMQPPICHLDIKPSNFIISGRNIYLIDFGTATKEGEKMMGYGTKEYADPRQRKGALAKASMDWYSLGKTIESIVRINSNKEFHKIINLMMEVEVNISFVVKKYMFLVELKKKVKYLLILFLIPIFYGGKSKEDIVEIQQKITEQTTATIVEKINSMEQDWIEIKEEIEQSKNELNIKRMYEAFISKYPAWEEAYVDYGIYLCQLKRWEEARSIYEKGKDRTGMSMEKAKQLKEKLGL